ncbi:MAG: hypothetical protein EOM26_04605 [Alphaproteobacteria bacterium]|nr:hypothetical protein [Alphaproteobacteria bacterium]
MNDPDTDSYGGMDYGDEARKSGKPGSRASRNPWRAWARFQDDEHKKKERHRFDWRTIFNNPITEPVSGDTPARYTTNVGSNLRGAFALGLVVIAPDLADQFHRATNAVREQLGMPTRDLAPDVTPS